MNRPGEILADTNSKADEADGTLKSIAALMLSFAILAERTAAASAPVRFLVLWILRYAESVAWNLVAKEVFGDDIPPDARHSPIRTGNSREDAALLALSFRALADALKKLAREEEKFERRLARWERKAERDSIELTLSNGRRFGDAFAQARALGLHAIDKPGGPDRARRSAFTGAAMPARASPVAFTDAT